MNKDLLRDLAAWEKGNLSDADIASRYPDGEGILRAHRLMRSASSALVRPAERAWLSVRPRLGARQVRSIWRLAPAVALGSIALLASMGAIASATAPVQTAEAIDHVLHVVRHHEPHHHLPLHAAPPHHEPVHTPGPAHTPAPTHHP